MHRVQDARQTTGVSFQGPNTLPFGLGTVLGRAIAESSSSNDLHTFESSTQSIFDQAAEQVEHGINTFSFELDQHPHLIWDEFLEDIIDASAWS